MKNKLNILKIIMIILNMILSFILIIKINNLNILPTLYFIIITFLIILINFIIIYLFHKKKKIPNIISLLLSFIIITSSIILLIYINTTLNFLATSFNNNSIETSTYNIIVIKDSNYKDIMDLDDKYLGYLSIDNNAVLKIKEMIQPLLKEIEDPYSLYEKLLNNELDSIILSTPYIEILEEDYPNIYDEIKIIYTFEINTTTQNQSNEYVDSLTPINIYISGSDSRSSTITSKSRSDVNMIITINPLTYEILLTSIPRDYYVQIHGKEGLKDKLTHAGIYGLETSTSTIEDLFSIKIDYSIKISMNSVTEIVDLLDGIDIESDTAFTSSHISNWQVKKGINHMNGEQALAYARERYAYSSGDRHRIQNQQQVLKAVLEKIISSNALLFNYEDILSSLSNLYRTDIPEELITLYVKNELSSFNSWNIETQWVNGTDASLPTYTSPNSKRYVMIPNEEEVNKASKQIINLLNKK